MTTAPRLILAAVVAALAVLATVPAAGAATYSVWSCRDLDGNPLPTTAWRAGGNAGARADTCASGGTLSAWLTGADTWGTAVSGYRFVIPHGVEFERARVWINAYTRSQPEGDAYEAGVGQFGELSPAVIDDGCIGGTSVCDFEAPGGREVGDSRRWPMLAVLALCPPGPECDPDTSDPAHPEPARVDLYRSEVVFDDPDAPTAGPVGGTIAETGSVSGTRSVRGATADEGSGVRRVELLVDGKPTAQQVPGGRCEEPYTVAEPCPETLEAAFDLDTTTLSYGTHTVAVRATDAAGNATTGASRAIHVDNTPAPPPPAPPVYVPVPVPSPPAPPPPAPAPPASHEAEQKDEEPPPPVRRVRLTAPKRIEIRKDGTARGRVTLSDGSPKPGAVVAFERRPIGDDEDAWKPFGRAITDGGGGFDLPEVNTSTEIRAMIADDSLSATPVIVRFVADLDAEIEASDRRLRNGDTLVLRGRFKRAGGALEEHPVLVQARVRGKWRTVDSVEADQGGRVTWRYEFEHTSRDAIYRFRLVLPRTKGLPWKRLATDDVKVRVDGR